MALSLSNFLYAILLLVPFEFISGTSAETHNFDWNVEWVRRNPDGMAERPVISINGQWPLPLVNVTKGDRVIVNLHNGVCYPLCFPMVYKLIWSSLVIKARVCIGMACSKTAQRTWMARSAPRNATFRRDIQ